MGIIISATQGAADVIYLGQNIIVEEYQTSRNYEIYFPVP
jgi:hypothetical protein